MFPQTNTQRLIQERINEMTMPLTNPDSSVICRNCGREHFNNSPNGKAILADAVDCTFCRGHYEPDRFPLNEACDNPPAYESPEVKIKPLSALDVQHGGDHYKRVKIQPVEYCHANGLGFLEGSAIKYITRHKRKGGKLDLDKAIHFLQMLRELEYPEPPECPMTQSDLDEVFRNYPNANFGPG